MMKRFLAIILSIAIILSLGVTSFAADTDLSAVLDKPTIKVSNSAQTVKMRVTTEAANDICGIGFDFWADEGLEIVGVENADENITYTSSDWNLDLEVKKLLWLTDDMEDISTSDVGTIIVNVPANTPAGTYNIYLSEIILTKTYGTVQVIDEESISATLTIEEDDTSDVEGYTAAISGPATKVCGENVVFNIAVDNTEENTYNAFFYEITFDDEKLEYVSASTDVVVDEEGTDTIIAKGYGSDRAISDTVSLTFTAKTVGMAEVTLATAKVDKAANASIQDAPNATIITDSVTVDISGYPVTLPEGFIGEGTVNPNEDYTFTANDNNYDYTLSATIGGESADVVDNGDGSFTVENVTGILVITETSRTAKTFQVSVVGTGASDVTAEETATYGTDFTFTVNKDTDYSYDVSSDPACVAGEENTYTITGANITKDIVITVNKTLIPPTTTTVTFVGVTAEEVAGGLTQTANIGEEFTFSLNKDAAYTYTAKVGSDTLTENEGLYTIPAAKVVASGVTVDITKTEINPLTVAVSEYVKLNGKSVFLVNATKGGLAEGQALAYGEIPMFWSEEYDAYCFLVISTENAETVKNTAEAAITVATAVATSIDYSGDVNKTNLIDVNDSQLIYNIYNDYYEDFSIATMEMFLRADANHDSVVNVADAVVVLGTAS